MKNLVTYYLLIIAPLVILFWLSKSDYISGNTFVLLLIVYVFVYRTYTDGMRLMNKGIIPKKDVWKMIIPGKRIQHFVELYRK